MKDKDNSFLTPAHPGRTRDGVVYTPPLAGLIDEEAMWSIKASLEARRAAPRRLRGVFARTAAGTAPGGFAGQLAAAPLATLGERGTLIVGIDQDMPPFHAAGKGIDAELAQAPADSLAVKLSLLRFNADANMNDDLRNRVWKKHDLRLRAGRCADASAGRSPADGREAAGQHLRALLPRARRDGAPGCAVRWPQPGGGAPSWNRCSAVMRAW